MLTLVVIVVLSSIFAVIGLVSYVHYTSKPKFDEVKMPEPTGPYESELLNDRLYRAKKFLNRK